MLVALGLALMYWEWHLVWKQVLQLNTPISVHTFYAEESFPSWQCRRSDHLSSFKETNKQKHDHGHYSLEMCMQILLNYIF